MAKAQIILGKSGSSASPIPLVPILTSDTTNVVHTSNTSSGKYAYYVFDGNDNTYYDNANGNEWYVGYQFDDPVTLSRITLKTRPNYRDSNKNKLEYLISGTWTEVMGLYLETASTEYSFFLDPSIQCDGFRIRNASGASYDGFISIQVYGSYA